MIQTTMISFEGVREPGTGSATYTNQLIAALAACDYIDVSKHIVLSSQANSIIKKSKAFLCALGRSLPYEWTMMGGVENEAQLRALSRANLLLINGFHASYFMMRPDTWAPYIYIMHDRHELLMRATIKGHAWTRRLLLNAIKEQEHCRMREMTILQKAAGIIAVSHSDYNYAIEVGASHAVWSPPAFDSTQIIPRDNSSRDRRSINIGMLGNTYFYPNFEGMSAVIASVWPHRANSRLNLVIAGRGTEIFSDDSRNITGLGYLPELSSFWDEIDILLVPNLNASGIGVKLCEAIARNVPVLTTRQGARGLPDNILNTLNCVDNVKNMCEFLSWDWLSRARRRNHDEFVRAPFLLPHMQKQITSMITQATASA
jgi:glycosyltransferase involved in cell wall biosynthesis